jgi:hypothetical protein
MTMNTRSEAAAAFRDAIEHPDRGVIGVVDDLLRLCREKGVQLDWTADCWRIRPLAGGSDELLDRPDRKSVFRAILARLAVLCNDSSPGSVSPYGGQGSLSIESDPMMRFHVSFLNTPQEQWLKLCPIQGTHSAEDICSSGANDKQSSPIAR